MASADSKPPALHKPCPLCGVVGHNPSTAGTFRKRFPKNSGKTPETLSERFLEIPSRVRLGSPKPYNSRHLRLPEHFESYLPLSTAGGECFFRIGSGEGLSEPVGHGILSSTGGSSDPFGCIMKKKRTPLPEEPPEPLEPFSPQAPNHNRIELNQGHTRVLHFLVFLVKPLFLFRGWRVLAGLQLRTFLYICNTSMDPLQSPWLNHLH